MITLKTTLWEEINFYRRQNKRLETEDLLNTIIGQTAMNDKKIKDNEERIEKLFCAMDDF